MSVHHHPDIATMMAFCAGTLDEAFATVIATHIAVCPQCRAQRARLEAVGGACLAEQDGAPMSTGALDALLGRLDEAPREATIRVKTSEDRVPAPLARHVPNGFDAAPWKRKAPGVWACDLATDQSTDGRLMLLRVAGGQKLPEHSHGGHELTLILGGAYTDRFGRFAYGDIADHDTEVEHQPIAQKGADCICLVAVDAKLNFRNRLLRVFQPLIGM